tara:strand:+ start:6873 stop:8357 length:1485 start_codon:yes stop_codon:yes gene_type:complete
MINNVVFRLDCGKIIGSGHLMRCLALARSLKKINYKCFFVAYDFTKEIIEKEINNEFQIFYLNSIKYKKNPDEFEKLIFNHKKNLYSSKEKDEFLNIILKKIRNVKIVIVDHYGLSYKWEKFIKKNFKNKLVVIDDFFNRKHFCDLLIDPTGQYIKNKFDQVNNILSGTKYAVINKSFHKQIVNKKKFIFVSFGSMDKMGMTLKTVNELLNIKFKLKIVVAISKFSKNYSKLLEYQRTGKIIICNEIIDINYFLNRSFCAIGAAGTSSFERIYLEIPSLVFKTALNQNNVLKTLSNLNSVQIGNSKNIKKSLIKFLNSYNKFKIDIIVDKFGAERIVPNLTNHKNEIEFEFFQNNIEHRDALFLMRNMSQHFSTSKITNHKIFYDEHNSWCNYIDKNNTDLIYIINYKNMSIGYLRYHFQKEKIIRKKFIEISIFIQDEYSNQNFGSYTLNFFNRLLSDQNILAEISKNNKSSLKFFEKNGFSLISKNKKIKLF